MVLAIKGFKKQFMRSILYPILCPMDMKLSIAERIIPREILIAAPLIPVNWLLSKKIPSNLRIDPKPIFITERCGFPSPLSIPLETCR